MSYDYEQTHQNIIKSAIRQFKEKGYQSSSIRSICNDAGVTNGAFYAHFVSKEDLFCGIVSPCLEGLARLYNDEEGTCLSIKSTEDVMNAFKQSYKSVDRIVEYVCEHREEFIFILESSEGSSFENFQDKITEFEAESMTRFFEVSQRYMRKKEGVPGNLIKMTASFLISTIFDCLKKGMSEEEILRETRLVSEYCTAGFRELIAI